MIAGLPNGEGAPEYSVDTFKQFIPKLSSYVDDETNSAQFNVFVTMAKGRLNYGIWLDEWNYAMSLAIAHYISITDPNFAQSLDSDATAGGIQTSRSIGSLSYNYDLQHAMSDNATYHFWNTTGYGRALVALANSRQWCPIIITN